VCALLAALFLSRLIIRNPEVIYVDQDVGTMVIVVKQPPLTQEGKITWWEVHEGAIKTNMVHRSLMKMEFITSL
jgi:hypothetical protein